MNDPVFPQTRWSVVIEAQAEDPAALAELCRAYWYPLYCYSRRLTDSPADAEDLNNNSTLFTVSFIGNLAVGNQNAISSVSGPVVTTLQDGFFGSARTTHQRGFPMVGIPDLGAAEHQGNADLRSFRETDWDGDGNPFGVEYALGMDFTRTDSASIRNFPAPALDTLGRATVGFGRNPFAVPGTLWIVERSSDLLGFTEIFRLNGNTVNQANGTLSSVFRTSILVTDQNPPLGGAFYRFRAVAP